MISKKELRAMTLRRLEALDSRDVKGLWARVESMEEFKLARKILIYWAMPSEVPTREFILKWCSDKQFVLPLVEGEHLLLKPYDATAMVEGYRGILEPSANLPSIRPEMIDFAIIPGVAFDMTCKRMGRGKGFYDRLLPKLHCAKAGVAFDCQIYDAIPVDAWDEPLDYVVSQSGISRSEGLR